MMLEEGTQHGKNFRLVGRGLPQGRGRRGDQLVTIR